MNLKSIPSLGRILAGLFRAPKPAAKDWGAKFGYAPAEPYELDDWNSQVTTRQVLRRRHIRAARAAQKRNRRNVVLLGYMGDAR